MNDSTLSIRRLALLSVAASVLQAQSPAPASASSPAPSLTPASSEVIQLSPFTVDASRDQGYRAENTLAGSRLNTPLRDTAASVSVFTEQFLQDLAITDIDQIIEYSVGTELDIQLNNAGSNANNHIGGANIVRRFDIRGVRASEGLDYFRSITPNDAYRIDRFDESRGPNGILFGVSSAGGLVNQSSILASPSRDSARLSYQLGSDDIGRAEVRFNKVIVPKKLGVAVAAVDQENSGWRKPSFQDKERLYGTLTFMPTERIIFRAMGERGNEYFSRVPPYALTDFALAWRDNREARGLNAVTVIPTNANPNAAQQALGIVARNANLSNAQRFIHVDNDGTVFNSAGTFITGSYENPAVRAPDGTPGVAGDFIRINDPSLLPYDINSAGPGMYRDQDLKNYTLTLDWRITDQLSLNLAHNYQQTDLWNPFMSGADPRLYGEPNRTLGVNGPANPYAGQLYIEGTWRNTYHDASVKETRLALSYDLQTRWQWLGRHQIAGLLSRSDETDRQLNHYLGFHGAPFNADPVNANNRLLQRIYIDDTNPRAFIGPDWRNVPATVTINNRAYDVGWVPENAGTQNSYATQRLDSRLFVLQSYFLDRRLITTFGYREDKAKVTDYGHAKDPVLRTDIVDLTKSSTSSVKGNTRTLGAVYHATEWLSFLANRSSNIGIPTFTNRILPFGNVPDPTEGEGEDYGFALDLFKRRLSLKAVYFKTNEAGQTASGGVNAAFNNTNIRIAEALESVLVGPGRRYSAAEWAPIRSSLTPTANATTFDMESDGFEVSLVANPSANWRITANYSYTDRIRTNSSDRDAVPWYGFTYDGRLLAEGISRNADGTYAVNPSAFAAGGTVARWLELSGQHPDANVSRLITSSQIPVAEEILGIVRWINDNKLENEQRWGLRPHKLSLFTAYDFTEGRLKGFSTGLGYRWRSASIVGRDAAGTEYRSRIVSAADLMLRYRHRVSPGRLRATLTYQLNVSNLLDRDGIVPHRFSSRPDFVVPGGRGVAYSRFDFIDPRSIRLTTTLSF